MTKSKLADGTRRAMEPIRRGAAGFGADVLSQVAKLLAGACEQAERGGGLGMTKGVGAVRVWKDDEYAYMEAEMPGVDPDAEFDLYLGQGLVFARIRLRDEAEPTISITKRVK